MENVARYCILFTTACDLVHVPANSLAVQHTNVGLVDYGQVKRYLLCTRQYLYGEEGGLRPSHGSGLNGTF